VSNYVNKITLVASDWTPDLGESIAQCRWQLK